MATKVRIVKVVYTDLVTNQQVNNAERMRVDATDAEVNAYYKIGRLFRNLDGHLLVVKNILK